ncbi:MAG: apolipoprotein N-acyltransferase [Alphaproteobacteria bacterium]
MKNWVISFQNEKNKIIGLCVAGVVSAYAMAPYYIWPFLWAGLSFLFYAVNKTSSVKKALIYGFCFGFGFGVVSMGWLANALMIDGGTFMWLIPFAWGGMGLLFGIFYALPAAAAVLYPVGWRRLVSFAGWFVIFEWVRSWILTGFPWNLLGQVWAFSPAMSQSAAVWGIYGLSLVTVLVCCSGAFWPKKKPMIAAGICLALLYLCGLWRLYDAAAEEVWGVRLRLVQPNIAQTLKWDAASADENYSRLIRLSRTDNEVITHVIWPESAVPFLVDKNESERVRMMGAVRQGGTLITGGLRGADEKTYAIANSIFILDDLADIQGFYDKAHLVPFGEFMPLRNILPLDKIVPIGGDFVRGTGPKTLRIPKAPPAGLAVCYEIIFSSRVVSKEKRPAWIINVSNDAWYGLSAGPYQHFDMAKMRAIEEGLPVVRATNNGISAVIDPYGRVVASLDLGMEGVVDSPLPRSIEAPFYAKTGEWPIVGLALLMILFCVKIRK